MGLWICAASAAEAHARATQLIKDVFITIFPSSVMAILSSYCMVQFERVFLFT